jgi:hypothetical protein
MWGGPIEEAPALRSGPLPGGRFRDNNVLRIVALRVPSVLPLAAVALRRSGSMLVRGAGSSRKRRAILGPRPVSDAYIDQCMAATLLARAFDPGAEGASALG